MGVLRKGRRSLGVSSGVAAGRTGEEGGREGGKGGVSCPEVVVLLVIDPYKSIKAERMLFVLFFIITQQPLGLDYVVEFVLP